MTTGPSDARPLQVRIADDIRAEIETGDLAAGAKLPTLEALAEQHMCSVGAVRAAVDLLKQQGLLITRQGKGIFVRERVRARRHGMDRYSRPSWSAGQVDPRRRGRRQGHEVDQLIRFLGTVPAPAAVAERLGIEPGTTCAVRRRTTEIDKRPNQLADSYYLLELAERVPALTQEDTGPGGGFARIEEAGIRLARIREEIAIRMPAGPEIGVLRLPEGTPVAELTRTVYDTRRAASRGDARHHRRRHGGLRLRVPRTRLKGPAMRITYATEAAPGRVNEDTAVCGDGWAVVLDGATAPEGVDSGCIHDVPWLVRHLSAGIAKRMLLDDGRSCADLQAILGDAILETRQAHGGRCDLANPDSPSSTVSIIRVRGDELDYLVLGDSPVVVRHPDGITVLSDDRIAHLPGGRPYTLELVRSLRNKPGGFWVASTEFEAARQAVAGSMPWTAGTEVGMFTDGVSRLVEFYGYDWESGLRDAGSRGARRS